jgi:subtilase family serine protease
MRKRSNALKKHIPTISVIMILAVIAISIPASHLFAAHASSVPGNQQRAAAATATTAATNTNTSAPMSYAPACSTAPAGYARCLAMVSTRTVKPVFTKAKAHIDRLSKSAIPALIANATGSAAPYSPTALHNAYNLPTTAATKQTIAVVDAFDDPNAEADLATYRLMFGLAPCTTDNGCFRKVNQSGGTTYPTADSNWGMEISLDLDMVSAICQNCNILLVEANSASITNLALAANEAATLGANEISNSYGASEFIGENTYCSVFYSHTGVAITASSGDNGLGVKFPASCPNVTAVGGTTLNADGTETAWNSNSTLGAGGGCSVLIKTPTWEPQTATNCTMRAVSDVSAVADPNTGVYIYDTFDQSGGLQVGGTSASAPIIAATFALAGGTANVTSSAALPWINSSNSCLNTIGNTSYSFQSGLGSPNGLNCF